MKLAVKITKRGDAFDMTMHQADNITGELGSALCGCNLRRGALRRLLPDPADTFAAFDHGMNAKTFYWPEDEGAIAEIENYAKIEAEEEPEPLLSWMKTDNGEIAAFGELAFIIESDPRCIGTSLRIGSVLRNGLAVGVLEGHDSDALKADAERIARESVRD